MDLVQLLIVVVVGVLVIYIVNSVIPAPKWLRAPVAAPCGLVVCMWLLQTFGLAPLSVHR